MRSLALLSMVLLACTSTRAVLREDLLPAMQANDGRHKVVATTSRGTIRVDPTSKIRLFNARHEASDWLSANDVHVDTRALYAATTFDVAAKARRITIRGLEADDLDELRNTRPEGDAVLEIDTHGDATLVAPPEQMRGWLDAFIDAVAWRHRADGDGRVCAETDSSPECHPVSSRAEARTHLQFQLVGGPLGEWTIDLEGHAPIELAGRLIFDRLQLGLATWEGWSWDEVAFAEVRHLSGLKTAGGILGGMVGIVVAAVAHVPGFSVSTGEPEDPGTWNGTPAVAGRDAPRLFGSGVRRRATARLVSQAELAIDTLGATQLYTGASVAARLGQLFELGGGCGHVATRDGQELSQGAFAFLRIGVHLPIDAAHRWAIPMSFDLGTGIGGTLESFYRFRIGFQRRLGARSFVALSLLPTAANWDDRTRSYAKLGTLAGSIEAGLAF
jgi:hypothetical protein